MPVISAASILRDAVLGFMRVHILHHCAEGQVYGLDIIDELRRHGCRVSPGTLYPMLHALEDAGFLVSERQVVDGKSRRYYRATAGGQRLLMELRSKIGELVAEVLQTSPGRSRSR